MTQVWTLHDLFRPYRSAARGSSLRAVLARAAADHPHVTVGLAALRFCDCTGLSALLAGARAAHARGAALQLRSVPVPLARLLRLSHTTGAFTLD